MTIPYGFWPSDWTAEKAASASGDFAELRAGHGGVFWVDYRPQDGRCTLWFWQAGQARSLTPDAFSIRSRVYEYGGGAFCVTRDGVAFVNEADQQVYLQALDSTAARRLSSQDACRYGDVQFDAFAHAILCIEETAGTPIRHRLVALSISDGSRTLISEGADFYASPAISSDGQRLAWIEWNCPEQPWTSTKLCVAHRSGDGWGTPVVVAGGAGNESLQQPRFDESGALHCLSDQEGWWQPWREQGDNWVRDAAAGNFDHAAAPWQLGGSSYIPVKSGYIACRFEQGVGRLVEWTETSHRVLADAFTRFRALSFDASSYYAIAAGPSCGPAVIAVDKASGEVRTLAGGQVALAPEDLSMPEAFDFPAGNAHGFGFFYAPTSRVASASVDDRPPLVVFLHGGPTSASYPVFDPRIQFWTQRGFAVADLNYRGSSGYGRAYRFALRQQWGVSDVEDAVAAVDALSARGLVDGERAFIRGGSAGGYTALCALAFSNRFRAGASLYGVSDPITLAGATHKFEGDYLQWLIGDPDFDRDRYEARTPLLHADQIRTPVIFFQGGRDAVVVPEQTESMVRALRQNGIQVEYHLYPEERHGFRQAANLADVMEKELAFYQRCM
ncbi:S9 family peptidase [Pseudomonas sp. Marseille-QA0892]